MLLSEIQLLKELLGTDQLEEILKKLQAKYPKNNDIIKIRGRLHNANQSYRVGELSNEEYTTLRNRIRSSILSLIDELKLSDYRKYIIIKYFIRFIWIGAIVFFIFIIKHTYELYSLISLPKNVTLPVASINQAFVEKKMTSYDNSGRKVELVIFIVRDFNWKLGGYNNSEKAGEEANICQHLREIGVVERLNTINLKGIVCFGNTSFEEVADIPNDMKIQVEEGRADLRAKFLASCVGSILKISTPVSISNLGKYTKSDKISTYQREIILAGVVRQDEKAINEEALFNGLVDWHELEDWKIDIRLFSKVKNNKVEIKRYLN